MEGLNKDEKEKSLKVNIVRHGPSTYRQPEWTDIKTADDLNAIGRYSEGERTEEEIKAGKEKAVEIIRKSAEEIAAEIKPDEEVAIWASPTGRTLETARIISEVLKEKGIAVRQTSSNEYGIKLFEKIGEVQNFSWDLFEPLMNGGEIEFKGAKVVIDKALSNPKGIGYPEYFTSDAIKDISEEAKSQWPKEYVDEIDRFESFAEVTERMISILRRVLNQATDKNYRIIIVSHDALTGYIVKTFTSGQISGINPGQFISLEKQGDKLVVKRTGDILQGDSETNIITEK